MPQRLLNEDWSDYDNRKKKREDRLFFSCEEQWELDYLISKLRKYFPRKTDQELKTAIASCCREVPAPRPRERFVRCVFGKLQ